jgi:PLP dependent protein
MDIISNIQSVKARLPAATKLIAISKTVSENNIMVAYHTGQRAFGENKVQELVRKYEALPRDIEWHLVGHLQSNKVKYIAPFVHLIHSVDSLGLLQEIDKQAQKHNRIIPCLLQVYIAQEDTKFGFDERELRSMLQLPVVKSLRNIVVAGLMGMASNTNNKEQIRAEFKQLKQLFEQFKAETFAQNPHFTEISMGMSSDYEIAAAEGSTMVRVGSIIFGERNYF